MSIDIRDQMVQGLTTRVVERFPVGIASMQIDEPFALDRNTTNLPVYMVRQNINIGLEYDSDLPASEVKNMFMKVLYGEIVAELEQIYFLNKAYRTDDATHRLNGLIKELQGYFDER
jgi:hypothetical protein